MSDVASVPLLPDPIHQGCHLQATCCRPRFIQQDFGAFEVATPATTAQHARETVLSVCEPGVCLHVPIYSECFFEMLFGSIPVGQDFRQLSEKAAG